MTQSQIDRELSAIKSWYQQYYPLCGFCGHALRGGGQLAHLVRRSYSRELQTVKLNVVLAHHDCHTIWDDNPNSAVYLPRTLELLYIIWRLSPDYFNLIAYHFEELAPAIAQFPDVPVMTLEHHGELLTLQYLSK